MAHMRAQQHDGYYDAIRSGTARTGATISAALSALGSTPTLLNWTFSGDGVWALTSSLTIPSTITTLIPPGVTVNRASGVTLTLNGPLISYQPNWETGPGTTVRSLANALELNRLNTRQILVQNDTTDAIVVRGVAASGAAVRMFVEQGGNNAGISISRTDSNNAFTWQFLNGPGGSLATARPGAGSMTLLTDTGLGIGLGMVPSALLQLLSDSAYKPGTTTWTITPSSAATKTILEDFTDGLALLRQFPQAAWMTYNGTGGSVADGQRFVGWTGEAVQAVAPYMVRSRLLQLEETDAAPTDVLLLDLHALQPAMLNALLELDTRLTALEAHETSETPATPPARRKRRSHDEEEN